MRNAPLKLLTPVLFSMSVLLGIFFAMPAYALDPALTVISPAPGEVVNAPNVNVLIDTDVGFAPKLDFPGYFLQLWLDAPSQDESLAIQTVDRGYIFKNVTPGLHTVVVAISDRTVSGEVVIAKKEAVDFQVIPPQGVAVPGIGQVTWYTVTRDALIFLFPIVGLALLLFWLSYITRRKK